MASFAGVRSHNMAGEWAIATRRCTLPMARSAYCSVASPVVIRVMFLLRCVTLVFWTTPGRCRKWIAVGWERGRPNQTRPHWICGTQPPRRLGPSSNAIFGNTAASGLGCPKSFASVQVLRWSSPWSAETRSSLQYRARFGLTASATQNLQIGGIFTVISVARSFALRRLFESVRVHTGSNELN
jgi:hypothetical protein